MNVKELRVDPNRPFRWSDHDPRAKCGFADRNDATVQLAADVERLAALQDVFAASGTHGLLIVLQGLDASGKDGIIKHVMTGLNPQGVSVYPFRQPTPEERVHDFIWRASRALPERGRIAIFNRSYYEEVLVVRVHPDMLEGERLPDHTAGDGLWQARYRQINDYERYLVENGILVLKFFLHVSREEQLKRLLERIDDADKNWKFSYSDLETPQRWDAYREAYEQMLHHTGTKAAPWYVIPADRKWVARLAVANILVDLLGGLGQRYPKGQPGDAERIAAARTYIEGQLKTRA